MSRPIIVVISRNVEEFADYTTNEVRLGYEISVPLTDFINMCRKDDTMVASRIVCLPNCQMIIERYKRTVIKLTSGQEVVVGDLQVSAEINILEPDENTNKESDSESLTDAQVDMLEELDRYRDLVMKGEMKNLIIIGRVNTEEGALQDAVSIQDTNVDYSGILGELEFAKHTMVYKNLTENTLTGMLEPFDE